MLTEGGSDAKKEVSRHNKTNKFVTVNPKKWLVTQFTSY